MSALFLSTDTELLLSKQVQPVVSLQLEDLLRVEVQCVRVLDYLLQFWFHFFFSITRWLNKLFPGQRGIVSRVGGPPGRCSGGRGVARGAELCWPTRGTGSSGRGTGGTAAPATIFTGLYSK